MEKDIKENPPVYVVDELTGTKQLDAQSRARVKKLNKLRKKTRYMVEGCIGGKTGWTSTAGGCYTGYVARDNMDVVIALMDATDKPTRFKDAVKLWDYAYDNFDSYTAEESGKTLDQMKVKRGSLREVKIGIPNDLKVTTLKGADPSKTVTTELTLNEEKPIYDSAEMLLFADDLTDEKIDKGLIPELPFLPGDISSYDPANDSPLWYVSDKYFCFYTMLFTAE